MNTNPNIQFMREVGRAISELKYDTKTRKELILDFYDLMDKFGIKQGAKQSKDDIGYSCNHGLKSF